MSIEPKFFQERESSTKKGGGRVMMAVVLPGGRTARPFWCEPDMRKAYPLHGRQRYSYGMYGEFELVIGPGSWRTLWRTRRSLILIRILGTFIEDKAEYGPLDLFLETDADPQLDLFSEVDANLSSDAAC